MLRTELLDLIAEEDGSTVVLDLSDVAFMDSTAIGVVIGARKRLLTQGRQLWIAAPSERVLRVLQIVALHKLVPIFGTVDEARQAAAERRNPSEQSSD